MSLSRAQHHFNEGQSLDAISELDLLIERHGSAQIRVGKRTLAKARLLRSLCFRCIGRLEEALHDLEAVILLDPTLETISLQQIATFLSEAKLFERSIVVFSRILAIDSDNLDALFGRAIARFRFGDAMGSLIDLDDAITVAPKRLRLRICKAKIHMGLGQSLQALSTLTSALEIGGSEESDVEELANAWCLRGIANSTLNRKHRAIADLDEAIRLSAKLGLAYNARSILSEDIGNKVYDLTKAINADPKQFSALLSRAICLCTTGKYQRSIRDATAALALQNLNIDALMCRSIARFCSKEMKLSLVDCNEVLRLHPSHAGAYFLRSKINLCLNMPTASHEDAKIALSLLPQTRSSQAIALSFQVS